MVGEGEHLGEIAHGGFGDVGLPVGVGGEGGGGVPGEGGRDSGEVLGVQGEDALEALDGVGGEEGDEGEDEHGDGVFGPAHLVGFVDAGELVEEALDGAEDDVGEGVLALEDVGHVDADGGRGGEDEGEEDEDLEPAVGCHGASTLLELFGLEEGVDEVRQKGHDDGAEEDQFDHGFAFLTARRSQPVV